MEDLEDGISLQAYAQRDPVNEYRVQSGDMFDEMIASVREETAKIMLMIVPSSQINAPSAPKETSAKLKSSASPSPGAKQPATGSVYGNSAKPEARKEPIRKTAEEKVGRNDPCPCGSGKKYKKCHGASLPSIDDEN